MTILPLQWDYLYLEKIWSLCWNRPWLLHWNLVILWFNITSYCTAMKKRNNSVVWTHERNLQLFAKCYTMNTRWWEIHIHRCYSLANISYAPICMCKNDQRICCHKTSASHLFEVIPDSKVHGANMGPTWVLSAPAGPHVGPMNLAIRVGSTYVILWWLHNDRLEKVILGINDDISSLWLYSLDACVKA